MQQQRQRQEAQAKGHYARSDHSKQYARLRKQVVYDVGREKTGGEKRAVARKSGSGASNWVQPTSTHMPG